MVAFATGFAFAAGRRLSLARFGAFVAFGASAAFFAFSLPVADGAAAAVTFSAVFAGVALLVFNTSFAGGAAEGAATGVGGAADAALVEPFGLPPLRANWASANIFRKASWASAINWT